MGEVGLDLDGQYSKDVREYLGKVFFNHLITVCSNAEKNCPVSKALASVERKVKATLKG